MGLLEKGCPRTMADTEKKNKPEDSDFKQQRLKAWQPILTPGWVILTFSTVGALFLAIGIAVLAASGDVVEISSGDYSGNTPTSGTCTQGNGSTSSSCLITMDLTIEEDMKQPIYMYYQLNNFYQNHRRYVKSRSDIQLRGDDNYDTATSCEPLATRNCPSPLTTDTCAVYPCGLIAWSVFNDTFYSNDDPTTNSYATDTFQVERSGTSTWSNVAWKNDGIAWASDKDKKFIATDTITPASVVSTAGGTCGDSSCIAMPYDEFKYYKCYTTAGAYSCTMGMADPTCTCDTGLKVADVANEEFIVWMRTSGLPEFRKLHRIIEEDLNKGDKVRFVVNNVFPVSGFDGEKKIVLSTTEWIGGKNQFLGWAYVVVAIICILLAVAFAVKQYIHPRNAASSEDVIAASAVAKD